jgi:hypothetical protein
MQARGWKSLSNLDGSERTFLERVRSPVVSVLLLHFLFLAIPFAVFPLVTEMLLGPQSWVTRGISAVSFFVLKLIPFAILLTVVGMYVLRCYVSIKLRRQQRVDASEREG